VELENPRGSSIEASCVYPAEDGLVVKTDTERVLRARKVMVELLLARCPEVEGVRQLAQEVGIEEPRFPKKNEDCILCGLCVRVCQERMGVGAVNFVHRGTERDIKPPYDKHSPICIACGACQVVCPTNCVDLSEITDKEPRPIMSEYNAGIAPRSSIYVPFPQAIPKVPVIDRETCLHYLKNECRSCENICAAKAIAYDQEDQVRDVDVGAVVLSPGFDLFDPKLKPDYGYAEFDNVITALELERLLSASGPYLGKVLRPSDKSEPERIAFIQCVGSRDSERDYCSAVCCMYGTKEAIIAKEHLGEDLKCDIYFMDMRSFSKGFEQYFQRAKGLGIDYIRCRPAAIEEIPETKDLKVEYLTEDDRKLSREYDLGVLCTGLQPSAAGKDLADRFGLSSNKHGFCDASRFAPVDSSREGVFVAGPFTEPKDIPETVVQGSAAAAQAMSLLADERWTLTTEKEYPPERDVAGQEPRIGVFVCHCGKNIGGVADVPAIVEYAKTLPDVAYAEENLYTCSTDSQEKMKQMIEEHDLNRVVVTSCSPRTHEPLFRNTCREAGLNEYLFEMANIRDQCTWVHMHEPEEATEKSRDLLRMAVAKARLLEPLEKGSLEVNNDALVIGGGMAGMTAALNLADQGFQVHLVEKEPQLGGNFRHVRTLPGDEDPQEKLAELIKKVEPHPGIELHLESALAAVEGSVGNFESTIAHNGTEKQVSHGVVIVATGAEEYKPTEYLYGQAPQVVTQRELEEKLAEDKLEAGMVVMIQCVGSRDDDRPYCSRICCSEAVKNALKIKEAHPETHVYVLYRDIRTYGFREEDYTKAREKGIRFICFTEDNKPEVSRDNGTLQVSVLDDTLNVPLRMEPDLVVLSAGIVAREGAEELGKMLKVPLTQERFFLEAHMKLRPVDFATDGVFMCGLAHSPKCVDESIGQAGAAAAKAATILSREEIELEATISEVVDANCDGCAYCIDPCPYNSLTLIEYMRDGAIKKTVERNEALCKGCGVCMATCPKQGIFVRSYNLEQIEAMVDAALEALVM